MTEPKTYRVYPSIAVPILLSLAAVYFSFTRDFWGLTAIPFILLGSVCSAPNFNLADGCLAILSILVGLAISKWLLEPLGTAIFVGSLAGWLGGGIEKRVCMRPVSETDI